jgi:hypothetical protein
VLYHFAISLSFTSNTGQQAVAVLYLIICEGASARAWTRDGVPTTSVDGVTNPTTINAGLEPGLHKAAKALFQTAEPLKGKLYTASKSRCNTNTSTNMNILEQNLAFRCSDHTVVQPFKDEVQTALFKDSVRTAL